MQTILVATDFSIASVQAARTVLPIAKALGAKVILAHAFSPGIHARSHAVAPRSGPFVPFLEAEAELQMEESMQLTQLWAEPLRSHGLEVSTHAAQGDPSDVVLEAAKQHGADLIVIGRRGHGGLRRSLLGSTSKQISERADVPVMLVPLADD